MMPFENFLDAKRVLGVLGKRFARYGLSLHPDKTRFVDFRNNRHRMMVDRTSLPSGWRRLRAQGPLRIHGGSIGPPRDRDRAAALFEVDRPVVHQLLTRQARLSRAAQPPSRA